jgi:SAM-dependent methyltransferase
MKRIIGAEHEFHDSCYAQDWAARFDPTPERLQLFDLIISQLQSRSLPARHILELGIGPGYLASRLLEAIPNVTYEGIDFSRPMLDLAAVRLRNFGDRVRFTQAHLVEDSWERSMSQPVGAILSTWALHDLGSEASTSAVYRKCKFVLPLQGILLNGDFIKPEGATFEYEPGRFPAKRHIEILSDLEFYEVECLGVFELELENPTPAQNYACFKAVS